MYKIGISSCDKKICDELFREYAENGISAMEISEAGYEGFDFDAVRRLAEKNNVKLWSFHLPFAPFDKIDISSLDDNLRLSTVKALSELIKRGSDIGIDKFIIHPSAEPIPDDIRNERMLRARESLSRLADVCEKCGSVLCVEDLPRTCLGHSISDMQFLTAEDERLKICFDTNHITVEQPQDVIRALGKKIATLHVSDFDFVNERHWLPGEGKIDWSSVVDALAEINYNGVWMYEIGYKCPKTIFRDRDLTAYDFKRNADEILNRKTPTTFYAPKPNLGMWE